jgi:cysteine desulfurase / selenocysteine lyase
MSQVSHNAIIDIDKIREEFPILTQQINGKPLVYFDNAATTQKPHAVIQALVDYYSNYNANIHRGIHTLAEKATNEFEGTRKLVREFINAKETEEIIFTKGTTEGINLVAGSFGRANVKNGDEVIISSIEHHSNIVPWQLLCQEKNAVLKVIPFDEDGNLDLDAYERMLSSKTKIVAFGHASNSLGTINPVSKMVEMAHRAGAVTVIDGAQSAPHLDIDVMLLDADFYCFSGHKMYGPTGCGVVYGKRELLEAMPPYQGGGEMVDDVTFGKTTYNEIPYKFEAGTPNIADVSALKQAINFINELGKENIARHEQELLRYATEKLKDIDGLRVIGNAPEKVSLVSFVVEGLHHFDIGMMLDARGIAVRTGRHCTQPIMDKLGIEGTVRASFAVYNTKKEIDQLVEGLHRITKMMR